ncbi:MAG: histidine phosphatase family protein [Spirochaetota bacterium]
MKELILIRHGETDWNNQFRIQGNKDIPLNNKGIERAEYLASYLNYKYDSNIDIIYSSDLLRAIQTVTPLSIQLNMSFIKKSTLREQNFGILEGEVFKELTEEKRELLLKVLYDKDYQPNENHGIESLADFNNRISKELKLIIDSEENKDNTIVVVTHGGVIKSIVCEILGLTKGHSRRLITVNNTSITTIKRKKYDGTPYIETLNLFDY